LHLSISNLHFTNEGKFKGSLERTTHVHMQYSLQNFDIQHKSRKCLYILAMLDLGMWSCTWWDFQLPTIIWQWKPLLLSTSPTFTSHNVFFTFICAFSLATWNLLTFDCKKLTTSLTFWIFKPWGFICSLRNSLFNNALLHQLPLYHALWQNDSKAFDILMEVVH